MTNFQNIKHAHEHQLFALPTPPDTSCHFDFLNFPMRSSGLIYPMRLSGLIHLMRPSSLIGMFTCKIGWTLFPPLPPPFILKSCRTIFKNWTKQKDTLETLLMQFEMVDEAKAGKIKSFTDELQQKLEAVEVCGKSFKKWLVRAQYAIGKDKVT